MSQLSFVPQPKRAEMREGTFVLDDATAIFLSPTTAAGLRVIAGALKQDIYRATGINVPVISSSRLPYEANLIVVGVAGDACLTSLAEGIGDLGAQGYVVEVTGEAVLAVGADLDGAAYALQTLRQVVRSVGGAWPAMVVRDWPSLPYRGVMMDVCRGKVPTLETVKLVIDILCLFKINVLQFYTEHTFAFASHPRIGENCGSLTPEDILELDAYARDRRLTLMPNLQAFGHFAHILRMPQYADLAESAALWSLSPVKEGTYELLGDMFGDLLPAFSCKTINLNCDETWDLGYGLSRERCDEIGRGRVYLEYINRLRDLAAANGCRIQIWGDILLHYPELVSELDEDVTLLDWHYGAADDYPSTRVFGESGRVFWVCPGTSQWNTIFPCIDNANVNIRNLIRQGLEQGASGVLNTDWGDHGHYQPIGQSWYGYAYGAEQSWTGGETEDATFDPAFGKIFFGARGKQVVEAIRALGALNTLEGLFRPGGSRGVQALFEDPVVAATSQTISAASLERVAKVSGEVRRVFASVSCDALDKMALEEMAYSARLFGLMARKAAFSAWLIQNIGDMPSAPEEALARLDELLAELEAIEVELVTLSKVFETQWMRRARRSEISISLGHLDGVRRQMRSLADWLCARKQEVEIQGTTNYSLDAYKAEQASYMILGEAERKLWNDLGIRR